MASRDDLLRDPDAIEQHPGRYGCGDGCCSGPECPLAEEATRPREEMERL